MSSKPKVSIVILNWNGENKLYKTLPTLGNIKYPNYEVIFVDNNSNDQSVEVAKKKLRDLDMSYSIVRNSSNEGYSKGKNIGADLADGKYIWLLDNDILIKKGCVNKMVKYLESNVETKAISPAIKFIENNHKKFNNKYNIGQTYELPFRQGYILTDELPDSNAIPTSTIPGATFFINRNIWERLEGYDELCEMKLDQHDLSMRLWISGYEGVIMSDEYVEHLGAPGGNVEDYKWYTKNYCKSRAIMILKNYQYYNILLALPILAIWLPILTAKWSVKTKSLDPIKGLYEGLVEIIYSLDEIWNKRKKVQETRTKYDRKFFKIRK